MPITWSVVRPVVFVSSTERSLGPRWLGLGPGLAEFALHVPVPLVNLVEL
jgi:hypothetical protein